MAVLSNSTICRTCQTEKDISAFPVTKNRHGNPYRSLHCRDCHRADCRKRYRITRSIDGGVDKIRASRREATRRYREAHNYSPAYRKIGRFGQHVRAWRAHIKSKAKHKAGMSNPKYVLDVRMAKAIRDALGKNKANRSWTTLVGYSVAELLTHIERQFAKGMSWSNMGEWHIDHRLPRASFKYTSADDEAFKQCWALTNLQPLWAKDNLSKGHRVLFLV